MQMLSLLVIIIWVFIILSVFASYQAGRKSKSRYACLNVDIFVAIAMGSFFCAGLLVIILASSAYKVAEENINKKLVEKELGTYVSEDHGSEFKLYVDIER